MGVLRGAVAGLLLAPAAAGAQVVSNTSGANTVLTGPAYNIVDTLGTYRGTNLFHSFQQFSLTSADTATFSGAGGTTNIIARVNGGQASSIDGTLRSTIAGANLWFINPSGIAFGPNAQLDVQGSFHASTASSVRFGGNGSWGMAGAPAGTLTVDPTAFGFLGSPRPMTTNGTALEVPTGETLTLAGGNITLNNSLLHAPGGRINLASVASAGEISLDPAGLGATGMSSFGAIRMTDVTAATEFIVGSGAPGPIFIRGGQLTMANSGFFTRHTTAGAGADIDVDLTGDLFMDGSALFAGVRGTGDAGDIRVAARNVTLTNFAQIDNSAIDLVTFTGTGRAGATTIQASGDVTLSNGAGITSITFAGSGPAGDVQISGRSLTLAGGASIEASTFGDGDGGNVLIDVGTLRVAGGSYIAAGTIFDARTVPGSGRGGDITANADNIVLDGGFILTESSSLADAGNINLTATSSVQLVNGSAVSTEAQTAGGGIINIAARDSVSLSGSRITTSVVDSGAAGDGGDINIDPVFVVLDSSQIIAQAVFGTGGNINIVTQYFLASQDSVVDASSQFGQSGTVVIASPNPDAGSGLTVLPSSFFDASALLRASCATKAAAAGSTFVAAGRGGLPAGPDSAGFGAYAFGPALQPARLARAPYRSAACGA